jgi:hypothetical protein
VIVPTSFDDMIVPDVVGNVITLPLVVVIVDTFTVTAVIVPVTLTLEADIDPVTLTLDAEKEPLLTIELPVILPSTVTLENTVCVIGAPLA